MITNFDHLREVAGIITAFKIRQQCEEDLAASDKLQEEITKRHSAANNTYCDSSGMRGFCDVLRLQIELDSAHVDYNKKLLAYYVFMGWED